MDYICADCGHIFESGEETIKNFDGEDWACCPSCGSTDILDGVRCHECGKVMQEDDAFDGMWCKECLLERLEDYELFFDYLTDDYFVDDTKRPDKVGGLEEFVFTAVWKLPDSCIPSVSSFELKEELKSVYYGLVATDRWCTHKDEFKRTIRDWMTDNKDPDLNDFAEWLTERECGKRDRKRVQKR